MHRSRRQRIGICASLPLRRSTPADRDVDITRTKYDALNLQSHKIAVAEFHQRGRLAWDNDVPKLMPNRGDNQFFNVWSRDSGDAACFVLAVLQLGLRYIVVVAHALLIGMARAHQVAAIIEQAVTTEMASTNAAEAILPLSPRKSAIVLKSGVGRPLTQTSSRLHCASRSNRRLHGMQFRLAVGVQRRLSASLQAPGSSSRA
jgi:hypothetical protein